MEERRLFSRRKVNIHFKFIETAKNKEGIGEITDISATGAGMIVTCERLEPAARLEMWLEIPDNAEPLHAYGRIEWLKSIAPGIFKLGIRFDKIDFMAISRALRMGSD